jgi:hypothetical protein
MFFDNGEKKYSYRREGKCLPKKFKKKSLPT